MTNDLRLKIARLRTGKTQRELALATNTSEALITKIETRRLTPSRELQSRIAAALGVERWEIF